MTSKEKKSPSKKEGKCPVCESRRLWLEHVYFTREVIILVLLGVDKEVYDPTVKRLLQNQDDIGDWFADKFGNKKEGKAVADLLKTHIKQAFDIIMTDKDITEAGNESETDKEQEKMDGLLDKWHKNAEDIAKGLYNFGKIHKFKWELKPLSDHMKEHLRLTTDEIIQFTSDEYIASIQTFEKVKDQIINFSDYLVHGITGKCECGKK